MSKDTQYLEDDELRRKISKMCEGIAAGYHGEDGIDYIMQLIKIRDKKLESDNYWRGFNDGLAVHREVVTQSPKKKGSE